MTVQPQLNLEDLKKEFADVPNILFISAKEQSNIKQLRPLSQKPKLLREH